MTFAEEVYVFIIFLCCCFVSEITQIMNVFSGKLDKRWVSAQNTFGVTPDILEE